MNYVEMVEHLCSRMDKIDEQIDDLSYYDLILIEKEQANIAKLIDDMARQAIRLRIVSKNIQSHIKNNIDSFDIL